MVYFRYIDNPTAAVPFDTGLLESEGRGLVSASNGLHGYSFYIRTPSNKPWYKALVTIAICTYGRPESLNDTLQSLSQQTFKNFEVVLITEKGNLSELRQKGLDLRQDILSHLLTMTFIARQLGYKVSLKVSGKEY